MLEAVRVRHRDAGHHHVISRRQSSIHERRRHAVHRGGRSHHETRTSRGSGREEDHAGTWNGSRFRRRMRQHVGPPRRVDARRHADRRAHHPLGVLRHGRRQQHRHAPRACHAEHRHPRRTTGWHRHRHEPARHRHGLRPALHAAHAVGHRAPRMRRAVGIAHGDVAPALRCVDFQCVQDALHAAAGGFASRMRNGRTRAATGRRRCTAHSARSA